MAQQNGEGGDPTTLFEVVKLGKSAMQVRLKSIPTETFMYYIYFSIYKKRIQFQQNVCLFYQTTSERLGVQQP